MGCLYVIVLLFGVVFMGGISYIAPSIEEQAVTEHEPITHSIIDYGNTPQLRTEDGAFILGEPDAPLTVVVWEDFLCPHCQNYQTTLQDFITNHVITGEARLESRMLPISSQSSYFFNLVECADTLNAGSFWEARDMMYQIVSTQQTQYLPDSFVTHFDLDPNALDSCLQTANQYQIDAQLGLDNGIMGTPSVVWRYNNSDPRFDIILRQPSSDDLTLLLRHVQLMTK